MRFPLPPFVGKRDCQDTCVGHALPAKEKNRSFENDLEARRKLGGLAPCVFSREPKLRGNGQMALMQQCTEEIDVRHLLSGESSAHLSRESVMLLCSYDGLPSTLVLFRGLFSCKDCIELHLQLNLG